MFKWSWHNIQTSIHDIHYVNALKNMNISIDTRKCLINPTTIIKSLSKQVTKINFLKLIKDLQKKNPSQIFC